MDKDTSLEMLDPIKKSLELGSTKQTKSIMDLENTYKEIRVEPIKAQDRAQGEHQNQIRF